MEVPHQIPKIIHYCWFGKTSLPEDAQRCIASWKKFCPDYEIVEWNETKINLSACLSMSNRHMQHKSGHLLQTMYAFML